MITTEKLTELRDRAYRAACDKGFHDEQKPDAVYKMLIITEIAEAVQADRKGLCVRKDIKNRYKVFVIDSEEPHQSFYKCEIAGKLEDELADIIIRMLDYCGLKQINMQPLESKLTKEKLPVGMQNFCNDMFYFCALITDWPDKYMPNTIAFLINYCESLGIDILWFVEMKMRYNETRERLEHGRIREIRFSGDFIGNLPADTLADRLTGAEFDRIRLTEILETCGIESVFPGVTAAGFAEFLTGRNL